MPYCFSFLVAVFLKRTLHDINVIGLKKERVGRVSKMEFNSIVSINKKGKKMKNEKPTGIAVRDVKGTTEKQPAPAPTGPQQIQVHAGNTAVLTVQLLGEVVKHLSRIAIALEKVNG